MSNLTERIRINAHAETCSQAPKRRVSWLSVPEMFSLNVATAAIVRAFGWRVFLVGSALERRDYRDVDVRCILPDEEFAKLCAEPDAWNDERLALLNAALSEWLSSRTGLPIDFQFQPRTEANEKFPGRRISLGVYIMPEAEAGHGGERADTGAPGELTPARLEELARLQQQATTGKVRFIPENGCLVDERGDIVADVQPLDEQDCILTQQDGEYLAALWTAGPALLAAARERETLRAQLWEEAARYLDAREAIAIWKVQIVTLLTRVSALEGALRDAADHLWKRHHCDLGNELLHPIPGPFEARALLTPTPETPADDGEQEGAPR